MGFPGSHYPATVLLKQAEHLITRLEKLTPDLRAAHHASGVRRTLLRLTVENAGEELAPAQVRLLEQSLAQGYRLLHEAARQRFR